MLLPYYSTANALLFRRLHPCLLLGQIHGTHGELHQAPILLLIPDNIRRESVDETIDQLEILGRMLEDERNDTANSKSHGKRTRQPKTQKPVALDFKSARGAQAGAPTGDPGPRAPAMLGRLRIHRLEPTPNGCLRFPHFNLLQMQYV